jgi:hypothetical protein
MSPSIASRVRVRARELAKGDRFVGNQANQGGDSGGDSVVGTSRAKSLESASKKVDPGDPTTEKEAKWIQADPLSRYGKSSATESASEATATTE